MVGPAEPRNLHLEDILDRGGVHSVNVMNSDTHTGKNKEGLATSTSWTPRKTLRLAYPIVHS